MWGCTRLILIFFKINIAMPKEMMRVSSSNPGVSLTSPFSSENVRVVSLSSMTGESRLLYPFLLTAIE